MSALERAINKAGGLTEFARLINVTPQVIVNWRTRKNVPPERCVEIEQATNGEVTRQDLRPDIFGEPPPKSVALGGSAQGDGKDKAVSV